MIDTEALLSTSVPILETFLRGTITFFGLLAMMMRIIGQRESGALGITDVLLVVLVAEASAVGLHGTATSVTDGLLLVARILFWSLVVDAISYRWPAAGRLLKAQSRVLIDKGVVNRSVVRRELMTHDEVLAQLRLHGIDDPSEVERACIEPNGMISVMRRDDSVVVSTGAHLPRLTRRFGVRTRVQAGRGYSFTVATDEPVTSPLYLPKQRIAGTPVQGR
jgi:uncharacterized membrane protein YcaP (DUF421 family)